MEAYPAELSILRDQLEEAREEVRQLKELFAPKIKFPSAWGLSKAESTILSSLYKHSKLGVPIPVAALHAAIGTSHREETSPKIVTVFICKMRKKLKPIGIDIGTRWGQGYILTPLSRYIIDNALAQQQAA